MHILSRFNLNTVCLGILLAFGPVFWSGCTKSETIKAVEPPKEVFVRGKSLVVSQVVWPKLTKCQGTLIANEVTTVGSKVSGQIASVVADLGDIVSKEAILVQLDTKDFKLQADQSDAQLLQARSAVGLRNEDPIESLNPDNAPPVREARAVWDETKQAVDRTRQLSARDAVSATDLELAETAERVASARYSSAQNGVREKIAMISVQKALRDLAHQRLSEATIRAPFGGVIESRFVSTGTYIQAGQPLMTIADTSTLRFRGSVPERFSQQIRIGQRIDLEFDLSDQVRNVTISRISPSLDPANRSLVFEANIDNADGELRSGLFGEGIITLDPEAKGIAIPTSAMVRFAGVDKVWKIIDGKVKEQAVTFGRQADDLIEIRSGIAVGDRILLNGKDGKQGTFESES
jgi:RND family efflux transporter MFP subunit